MTTTPAAIRQFDPARYATIPPELEDRFWARVERGLSCWRWVGSIHPQTRYGAFSFRGRGYRAHRLCLMMHGHCVPPDMDVCHTCDNRWCVNPEHLYVGTRKQNMADCTARQRHNKPLGETHWCAKLSAIDVRQIRELRDGGALIVALAEQYGVHHSTISRIVRRVWRGEVA